MSSVEDILSSLAYTTQQANIYLRIAIFIFGFASNVFNIIVFLSLQTFRESSCAFYLIAMSFVNIGQLILGLLNRTLTLGFAIDWTITSLAYCKFRSYLFQVCSLLSYSCLYLATIDQYLATCSRPRLQRLSNIKLARWLFAIISILWILHGIPILCYYDHVIVSSSNQTTCKITDVVFQQYYNYFFLLVLLGIVPVITTVLFGCLAYRNVQKISYRAVPLVRRETDKQLTVMVLAQDVYNLFFIIPYIIVYSISFNTNNASDAIYVAKINLASTITGALYYMPFSSGFYIYACASERFRRQFLYVLFKMHFSRFRQDVARNQILPRT